MDPVYQDEAILGFQGMIDDKWSWGVRGIYRKLHNAIDDMEITSNGILCDGEPGSVGFVMANPGDTLTVYTDTDCDGENDGFVDIDTSRRRLGAVRRRRQLRRRHAAATIRSRTYKALEFVLDRAWDDTWSLNASYTWSRSEGNAEGPVNSDTNFGDSGRTEAFDDPWVNFDGYGYLPNDRRHQIKARGTYAFNDHWQLGGTLDRAVRSPDQRVRRRAIPSTAPNFHSFYICMANCTSHERLERVYELRGRGNEGRTPWTYDVGASITLPALVRRRRPAREVRGVQPVQRRSATIEVDEELQTRHRATSRTRTYGLPARLPAAARYGAAAR